MLHAASALQRCFDRLSALVGHLGRPGAVDCDGAAGGVRIGLRDCASIIATAMLPDYTNRDISEEHA